MSGVAFIGENGKTLFRFPWTVVFKIKVIKNKNFEMALMFSLIRLCLDGFISAGNPGTAIHAATLRLGPGGRLYAPGNNRKSPQRQPKIKRR